MVDPDTGEPLGPQAAGAQPESAPVDPDPRRLGPAALHADSWELEPEVEPSNEPYRGVRRAVAPRSRLWFGVMLALAAVVAVVVVWLITPGSDAAGPSSALALPGAGTDATRQDLTSSPESHASGAVASGAPPVTASAGPGGTHAPPAGFGPVTYEAEAGMPGVRLRGVQIVDYAGASGGQVVQFGTSPGSIQIRSVSVPTSGSYRVTIYYVPDGVPAGATATVTVDGSASVTATFAAGGGCCLATTVDVALTQGGNSITLANPSGQVPKIDRIVITG